MRHATNLETVLTYEGTSEIHQLVIGQQLTGLVRVRLSRPIARFTDRVDRDALVVIRPDASCQGTASDEPTVSERMARDDWDQRAQRASHPVTRPVPTEQRSGHR